MTVRDIIERALRIIGVLAVDETAPGEHADVGLQAYNAMLAAWKLQGINLYTADQPLHATPVVAPEYREGTAYVLASRLAPMFSAPVTFNADRYFRLIRAHYAQPDASRMPVWRHVYSRGVN